MITFIESKETTGETEKCLDSQLWHACAGSMVQMPPVNSTVFYFPQGHAEHSSGTVDFGIYPMIPAYVLCKISSMKFMADPETDEVFARIGLVPVSANNLDLDEDDEEEGFTGISNLPENQDKPTSFAKTLTQSDANNGGGFSVPRYCAETIFPRLDYAADPPVQTILAKDVLGETWKFRHIYRGTPRRHLLTTGWSNFVNHKKLIAGDSIVFLRVENGDLCLGIRRAKRGNIGLEMQSGWGKSSLLFANGNPIVRSTSRERIKPESVIEAATLASNGQPFEIVYYPRASTPEFFVRASLVKAALRIRWCSGIRFKMAFETEDSSRISWFMGTVASTQLADPIRWPDSPWRLLQVTWDEPDLLQNVKRVSPWLVELVSNVPPIHISPFSPPRKKLRLQHLPDLPLDSRIPIPIFSSFRSNTPAGMQGARHAQYGFYPIGFDRAILPVGDSKPILPAKPSTIDNVSCLLTMGNSTQESRKSDVSKATSFVLFGQPILTKKEMSVICSTDPIQPAQIEDYCHSERSSNEEFQTDLSLETSQCKVSLELEGRSHILDLSLVGSYEELYGKLASMFGIEISGTRNRVLYWDNNGASRQLGEEPFSNFIKAAKRLTISSNSSNENVVR